MKHIRFDIVRIEIESEPLLNGAWQPQWFSERDGVFFRHTSIRWFQSREEANKYAEKMAQRYVRILRLGSKQDIRIKSL